MTQSVARDAFADAAFLPGGSDGPVKHAPVDVRFTRRAGEQPGLRWAACSPILSQTLERSAGQGDLPVSVPLPLLNPHDHPFAVDVVDLQPRGF